MNHNFKCAMNIIYFGIGFLLGLAAPDLIGWVGLIVMRGIGS